MRLVTGAFQVSKSNSADKVSSACEDSFFITDRGFGVADGVSGWNDYGFSSSAFSTQLMDSCKSFIETYLKQEDQNKQSKKMMQRIKKQKSYLSMENLDVGDDEDGNEDQEGSISSGTDENRNSPKKVMNTSPKKKEESQIMPKINSENVVLHPIFILQKAFTKVSAVGSSTALVAIRNQKQISIANLGDSGFAFIRFKKGEAFTFARSKDQQHSFNIPYQLSILPTDSDIDILKQKGYVKEVMSLKKVLKNKNNLCQDTPDMADEYEFELQDGDIVVSATDGVFDNLFMHEILKIVKDFKIKVGRIYTKE